jgi:N utilization substance protein B
MAFQQQKFREIVFQMLYSSDIGKVKQEDIENLLMKELAVTKKTVQAAYERVKEVQKHQKQIDALIAETSQDYQFDRIQAIERNVLRLALYEMLHDDQIPPKVAIAEAIRLSRKFSTPESSSFINAILDAIYKSSQGEQANVKQMSASVEALIKSEELANKAALEEKKREPKNEES